MPGVESWGAIVSETTTAIATLSLMSIFKECLLLEKQVEKAEMTEQGHQEEVIVLLQQEAR